MKHESVRKAFENDLKNKKIKKPDFRHRKNRHSNRDREGAGPNNKYLTYEQAKIFIAQADYITSSTEYKEWVKIKKYKFLPITPTYAYRQDWEGWPEYLNVKRVISSTRRLPYYEAKSIVQELAIKHNFAHGDCFGNWIDFCDAQYILPPEERELPEGIPRYPHGYYDEWEGWPAWVGKGLKSKIEHAQHKERLIAEARDSKITEYNGQPVYAITTGIDPMNPNMIKVIVDNNGLSSLIATCNSLMYEIISVYIFDKTQLPMILDNLTSHGTDKGDSCFTIHNMPALLSSLDFDTIAIPKDLY